jgi:Tfp pilus assembly protein PilN
MGFYLNVLAEKELLKAMSQQTLIEVEALKEEKVLKEKILLSSGIGNKSFLTKYVTDIGNSVPQNIVLNTIYIMPSFKKIKASEKINFDINGITITGESENDKSFNDWLKKLEALTWIRKMDIEDYSQETKTENTFTIKIKI